MNFRKKLSKKYVSYYARTDSAITLITLAVTIIILLILAGVAINLVTGDDGILNKAGNAVDKTINVTIQEELQMAIAEAKTSFYKDTETSLMHDDYIYNYLNNEYKSPNDAIIKYDNGKVIYIPSKGKNSIIDVDLATGTIGEVISNVEATTVQEYNSQHPELHIPTGFQYKTGTVETGYVITDAENASSNDGNEFVWIPVASSEDYARRLGTVNTYMKSGSSGNDTGLTVETAIQGDALGVSSILGKAVIPTLDASQSEAAVVNAAGGFWVGRYEAGVPNEAHNAILGTNGGSSTIYDASNEYWDAKTIYVKENHEPARTITQTQALKMANNWKSGEAGEGTVAFQSGLITGTRVGYNV